MIYWTDSRAWLMKGDSVEVLRGFGDHTFDSVVCDPPYGLEFMGKEWDRLALSDNPSGPQSEGWHDNGGKNPYARRATPRFAGKKLGAKTDEMQAQQAWHEAWAREALRVLKPGGHLVAFGGTRTYHRLACALEDAGFELRDSLMWLYGTGFPKSLNVGEGWGTALKPAHEPIVLARKPLEGTVAANVQKWGTGALNIDGCRIATQDKLGGGAYSPGVRPSGLPGDDAKRDAGVFKGGVARKLVGQFEQPEGRWPANVVLDEEAGALLDAQSGGASRFFYSAKTSRDEREVGLEALPARTGAEAVEREEGSAGTKSPRAGAGRTAARVRNHHPTVKPIALMRWLVRLVTPPNGLVLDPFVGSGSTGCAAALEGMRFVGVEKEEEYLMIAAHRIIHWSKP